MSDNTYIRQTTFKVQLKCDHWLTFKIPPQMGEMLWCRLCESYRRVIGGDIAPDYRVHCLDCRYHPRFGSNRVTAASKAMAHAQKKKHTTELRNGHVTINTFDHKQDPQLALDDIPPF